MLVRGTVKVRGNGLIGRIAQSEEGVASNRAIIFLKETVEESGIQRHKKITNDETSYHLEGSFNGGAFEETGLRAAFLAMQFGEDMEPTLRQHRQNRQA